MLHVVSTDGATMVNTSWYQIYCNTLFLYSFQSARQFLSPRFDESSLNGDRGCAQWLCEREVRDGSMVSLGRGLEVGRLNFLNQCPIGLKPSTNNPSYASTLPSAYNLYTELGSKVIKGSKISQLHYLDICKGYGAQTPRPQIS